MSGGLIPAYVDVRKAFQQELEVTGSVEIERLPRVREAAASDKVQIAIRLRFATDRSGQKQIEGELTGSLEMTCQRCLAPAEVKLQESIKLALLVSEDQINGLDPEWDPWICIEPKLELADLVEEQMMLALPIVHLHEDRSCIQNLGYVREDDEEISQSAEKETDNPFSILQQLKEDTTNNS